MQWSNTRGGMTQKHRLLLLSRYDRLGASSRVRIFQYIPFLEEVGIQVQIEPFFDDHYLCRLYATTGKRRLREVLPRYLKRLGVILASRKYSAAWVEKETFPFLPAVFERLLVNFKIPYIVDYDDATFHTYDQHRWSIVRQLLGRSLNPLIAGAQCVIAGSSYLVDYARSRGAKRVELIPTVVDIKRYRVTEEPLSDELRIGWIGSPMTTKYLYEVREVLRELSAERPIRLVTIGAAPLPDYGVPLEQHAWSESTEGRLLESIHVGIMPLPDTPWERGKCGYKLIQYMACGRPVVGSPVGVNGDIVTKAVGYLADGTDQWIRALRVFADNPDHRRTCGTAARELVERQYSIQVTAPRIVDLIEEICAPESKRLVTG